MSFWRPPAKRALSADAQGERRARAGDLDQTHVPHMAQGGRSCSANFRPADAMYAPVGGALHRPTRSSQRAGARPTCRQ